MDGSPERAIAAHLTAWLGDWPPPPGSIHVVASPRRDQPAWDGRIRPLAGVSTPDGAVLSVPPDRLAAVQEAVAGRDRAALPQVLPVLAAALGQSDGRVMEGIFRWTVQPVQMPDAGEWRPVDDPVVPPWLKPFGGEVLVALDSGRYIAGVGLKRHDPTGEEIAVVTEPEARGRGLARRLVTQASRRVVARGAVVTYLHAPDNTASAHVAEASGFPDLGWRVLALAPA